MVIDVAIARGYFHIRRRGGGGGGLGPHIKFGGKIWGKVRPSSPNKRKNLGNSVTARRKSWEKIPILGSYLKFRGQKLGYLPLIFLEAKFGAPTRISEANFEAKLPRPPNMEVPPGCHCCCDLKEKELTFPSIFTVLKKVHDMLLLPRPFSTAVFLISANSIISFLRVSRSLCFVYIQKEVFSLWICCFFCPIFIINQKELYDNCHIKIIKIACPIAVLC